MAARLSSLGRKLESGSQMMKRLAMTLVAACSLMAAPQDLAWTVNTEVAGMSANSIRN